MITIHQLYTAPDEANAFIAACEADFEKKLQSVSDRVLADKDIKIITLAGPTCSGKTTTAAKLTVDLEKAGKRARVLSIDDFYFNEDVTIRDGKFDFESADAIDLAFLKKAVSGLHKGESVLLPTFDFSVRKRVSETAYIPGENDIYIFEGIQAVYPQVTSMLRDVGYKSIFISVAEDAKVCDTLFGRHEIRLMRRIVRDFYHRASSAKFTMYLWSNVRANEEENVFPYAVSSDIIINSLLPYELLLVGRHFLKITEDYPADGSHPELIASLRQRLQAIEGSAVCESMIPMNSVFREFII